MSRDRETEGLDDRFYRHYQPKRKYYQDTQTIRKKSRKLTFLNIGVLLIAMLAINFVSNKNSPPNSTLTTFFHYDIESDFKENQAIIDLLIKPLDGQLLITPFSIAFAWQNQHNVFARYDILDNSLWNEEKNGFYIRHQESAMLGAILYITITKEGYESVTIIKKME